MNGGIRKSRFDCLLGKFGGDGIGVEHDDPVGMWTYRGAQLIHQRHCCVSSLNSNGNLTNFHGLIVVGGTVSTGQGQILFFLDAVTT